jgi:chemotaxis protein MotB
MMRENIHMKRRSLPSTGGWQLGSDLDFAADLPSHRASAAVTTIVPSHSHLPFLCTLGFSLFLHAAVFGVTLPITLTTPPAAPLPIVELALETEVPSPADTADTAAQDDTSELQVLQEFHASALERTTALEERLSGALTQQAETEAAHQQQLASLEATNTVMNDQVETLTGEKADLSAQLANERQRREDLERQLQEQTRAREAEISGVTGAYDRLVAELQGEISQKEIALHRVKEKLTVSIVDRVLFPSGQATLTPDGRRIIEKVGVVLAKVSDRGILIEGHTDNVPIGGTLRTLFPSNWELSTARATEVVKYLIAQGKLPANRLSAVGRADTAPVADNDSEAGRMQNRRIEIILLPPEDQPSGLS